MSSGYFDCFSGISGDMTLGALIDAGFSLEILRSELAKLPIGGYRLDATKVTSKGLTGTRVTVDLDDRPSQPHRRLADVAAIINEAALDPALKTLSIAVFRTLAEVEAQIHGIAVDEVHFHEVGAVDAIVDVVGAVVGLTTLKIDRVYASSVPAGGGTVQTAHGLLPVPAPATLALLSRAGAPIRPSQAETELVTPTGAAILATMARFEQPAMRLRKIGYGFGRKELPWANVLRFWIGDEDETTLETDSVSVIEANLDDQTPEALGAAMSALLAAGALDVYFTPIQMKKNRPAVKLTVLAPPELERVLATRVLVETTSLGVRIHRAHRLKSRRWQDEIATPWGPVRLKIKEIDGERRASPEFDDCLRLAQATGVTFADVFQAASAAARQAGYAAADSHPRGATDIG